MCMYKMLGVDCLRRTRGRGGSELIVGMRGNMLNANRHLDKSITLKDFTRSYKKIKISSVGDTCYQM